MIGHHSPTSLPELKEQGEVNHGDAKWINNMVIEENKSWACFEAIMGDYPDVTTMEFEIELHLPPAAKAISSKKLDCLLVKKMRDSESEVIFSKLSPEHRALFTGAKTKEVNSFLQNQAVRKSLNDAELQWPSVQAES